MDRRSFIERFAGAAVALPGAYVLRQPIALAAPAEAGIAVPEAPQLILATKVEDVSPRRMRIELDWAAVRCTLTPRQGSEWYGLDRYSGPAQARFTIEGNSRAVVSEEVHPLLRHSVVTGIDVPWMERPAALMFEGRARIARVFLELEMEELAPEPRAGF